MLERTDPRQLQHETFRSDVADGLSRHPKTLPPRWLYDDHGSALFEEITRVEDYYPTRTETGILHARGDEIAAFCGRDATLVEYGAGAGVKTEIVLGALGGPRQYVPIDIAGDFLAASAQRIGARFPGLAVRPVVADFTADFELPEDLGRAGPRIGFFPGSTIGNLDDAERAAFLRRMRRHVGTGGKAIVGADLRKDVATLVRAYDDGEGVTAAFNLNILRRINRELDGDFRLDRFAHEARWNEAASAVEMHLRSLEAQTASVAGRRYRFAEGETIHTESSRKFTVEGFGETAAASGWRVAQVWTDEQARFAVFGLVAAR